MIWFAARKLLGAIVTVFVSATLLFFLLELTQAGSPAAGTGSPMDNYLAWIRAGLTGQFGVAPSLGQPVANLLLERGAVSLPLAMLALLLAVVLGGAGTVACVRWPGSAVDKAVAGLSRFGAAIPEFWLGIVLALVFSTGLRWLPLGGFVPWTDSAGGALLSLLMPAAAIGLPLAAQVAMAGREAFAGMPHSDLILTARARGLTRREAMWRHGLRNGLPKLLLDLRRRLPALLASTAVVETVFYLPGLGRLLFDGIAAADLALVRGSLILLIALICGTLFLLDLGRAALDPRMRAWRAS